MSCRELGSAFRGEGPPPEPLYAESLFGRLNCRWSSLRAWTAGDWKLIDGSRAELFHLAEDPGETRDRAAEEAPRVARMRADLRAAMARMAPGGDHARTAAITPEQEANLKSLGYVGGSGGGGELDEPGLPDPRDRVQFYERMQIILRAQNIPLERASAEAAAMAEADPGNPFAQTTVASLAYRAGRLSAAARAYRRSLELDPDRPPGPSWPARPAGRRACAPREVLPPWRDRASPPGPRPGGRARPDCRRSASNRRPSTRGATTSGS